MHLSLFSFPHQSTFFCSNVLFFFSEDLFFIPCALGLPGDTLSILIFKWGNKYSELESNITIPVNVAKYCFWAIAAEAKVRYFYHHSSVSYLRWKASLRSCSPLKVDAKHCVWVFKLAPILQRFIVAFGTGFKGMTCAGNNLLPAA